MRRRRPLSSDMSIKQNLDPINSSCKLMDSIVDSTLDRTSEEILYSITDIISNVQSLKLCEQGQVGNGTDTSILGSSMFIDYENLENYELGELIGQGSFGSVHKAWFISEAIDVAVKTINFDEFQAEERQEAQAIFEEEMHISKMLANFKECTFLPKTYAAFRQKQCGYIITELLEGFTLQNYLTSHYELSQSQIKYYLASLLSAIEELHEKIECVHRDIKPENIMILADGTIKLIDFGCSKIVGKKGRSSQIIGTYQYFSPQRFGEQYSYQVDLWAFAVIAYELVTKDLPFSFPSQEKCEQEQKFVKLSTAIRKIKLEFLPPQFNDHKGLSEIVKGILNSSKQDRKQKWNINFIKSQSYFEQIHWNSVSTPPVKFNHEQVKSLQFFTIQEQNINSFNSF